MRLEGKVALITGGASGIGRSTALLFAREGARVAIADVSETRGAEVLRELRAHGAEASFVAADVAKDADVAHMVGHVEKTFGRLDVLFNNAGVFETDDASVLDTSETVWDRVMAINLKGVFLGCKHGIPALLRSGGGSVINTASFVALMGAAVPQIAYTASKGGVLAMTREIAVEFAQKNIRANALCPGPVETPLLSQLLADPARRHRRLVHIPMGRFAQADDIAQAALFLASDDSTYVTGVAFSVDGGLTAAYITPE